MKKIQKIEWEEESPSNISYRDFGDDDGDEYYSVELPMVLILYNAYLYANGGALFNIMNSSRVDYPILHHGDEVEYLSVVLE